MTTIVCKVVHCQLSPVVAPTQHCRPINGWSVTVMWHPCVHTGRLEYDIMVTCRKYHLHGHTRRAYQEHSTNSHLHYWLIWCSDSWVVLACDVCTLSNNLATCGVTCRYYPFLPPLFFPAYCCRGGGYINSFSFPFSSPPSPLLLPWNLIEAIRGRPSTDV